MSLFCVYIMDVGVMSCDVTDIMSLTLVWCHWC